MIDAQGDRSILFVVPYPIGNAPSQRFRFEQYFSLLGRHHFRIAHQSFWQTNTWVILFERGHSLRKALGFTMGVVRRLGLLFRLHRYQYVFIHREAMPVGPPVFEWIIAKVFRKRIIYDFDDAIWLPNTSEENALVGPIKWHSKVGHICRWSHTVSAGNEYLASFARSWAGRVVVNPTTVDTEHTHRPSLDPRGTTGRITLGWTGSHSTLPYLQLIEPALIALEKEFPDQLHFVVIANRSPQLQLKNFTFVPWRKASEIEDLSTLDIGVMPLADDPWAKGKCGLKALQYMALAIPTVASPVGINTEIIDHGTNGYLCNSIEMWYDHLKKLIADPGLRKQLGDAGRKKVEQYYSTASNESVFLSLFE